MKSLDIQVDFPSPALHIHAHTHTHTQFLSLPEPWNKTEIWPQVLSLCFELPQHLRLKHWWRKKASKTTLPLIKGDLGLPRQSLQSRKFKVCIGFLVRSIISKNFVNSHYFWPCCLVSGGMGQKWMCSLSALFSYIPKRASPSEISSHLLLVFIKQIMSLLTLPKFQIYSFIKAIGL